MKKLFLIFGVLLGLSTSAFAQVPCPGVGGVNSVPQLGVSCVQEPGVSTYAATSVGLVPASSATDIACLTGAVGKVVRVQQIRVSGSAGTLINVPVTITKHVSANTGGTAATSIALPVPYALDSTNSTAGATTTAYTANPTINDATPGVIDNDVVGLSTTGTTLTTNAIIFDYTPRIAMQAPILRSAAQQVCVNFNSISVSSGVVNTTFKWTEAAQ